jgi:N-acetylglucosamine-6-phosphate deacetylase
VQNVMKFANWNLQQAVRLATLNPARTAGLPSSLGSIVVGGAADLVALSASGEVRTTIVRGQVASVPAR